jgi:hypothetical protein
VRFWNFTASQPASTAPSILPQLADHIARKSLTWALRGAPVEPVFRRIPRVARKDV